MLGSTHMLARSFAVPVYGVDGSLEVAWLVRGGHVLLSETNMSRARGFLIPKILWELPMKEQFREEHEVGSSCTPLSPTKFVGYSDDGQ